MLRALATGVLLTDPTRNADTGSVTALMLTERGGGDGRLRLGLVATGAAGEQLLVLARRSAVSVVGPVRQVRIVDADGRDRTVLRLTAQAVIGLPAAPESDDVADGG